MNCPLCGGNMVETDGGKYLTCQRDTSHIINQAKELSRYNSGEKGFDWLKARMKVHYGKKVHTGG